MFRFHGLTVVVCLAALSATSDGAVVELYTNGTLVVDGSDLDDEIKVSIEMRVPKLTRPTSFSPISASRVSTTKVQTLVPYVVVRHTILHDHGPEEVQPVEFPASQVAELSIHAYDGDDLVENNTSIPSVIRGGYGHDELWGGSERDYLDGGGDSDLDPVAWPILPYAQLNDGADEIYGRGGNDVLKSGDSDWDRLSGGDGDDELWSASAWFANAVPMTGVLLSGGDGVDEYYFHAFDDVVLEGMTVATEGWSLVGQSIPYDAESPWEEGYMLVID